jgi:hypothetical protein
MQDPTGLVLVPHGLELPAGAGASAVPSNDATVSSDRVAVLVDAVGRLTLLSLVLHLCTGDELILTKET